MGKHIGNLIKSKRELKGWTQSELAVELDCSDDQVSRWETGQRNVSKHYLPTLMAALEITAQEYQAAREKDLETPQSAKPTKVAEFSAYYSKNRPILQKFIRDCGYYEGLSDTVKSFPLVTRKAWVPKGPIPIKDVILRWEEPQDSVASPTFRKQQTFAEFNRRLGKTIDNNFAYRLLAVTVKGGTFELVFGPSYYDGYVNSCEVLGWELSRWYVLYVLNKKKKTHPRKDGKDLEKRGEPEAIWDLTRRVGVAGINTLCINLNHPNDDKYGNASFLLHDRKSPKIAEAQNTYHVVPAGTFQPDSFEDKDHQRDFSFERNILREYAEELLGKGEFKEVVRDLKDFRRDLRIKPFSDALGAGGMRFYFLGLGFDPITTKPEILTAMIIDWSKLPSDAPLEFESNWEGEHFSVPLKPSYLDEWAKKLLMLPAGAACLAMGSQHLTAMLADFDLTR